MAKKQTKVSLNAYTTEQLQEELDRRKYPEPPYPHSATNISLIDLCKIRDLVVDNVKSLQEEGRELKDIEHYIYQAAMQAVYGEEIWDFVNAILE